ncbi:MAG: DUF1501 domain-containing protein [Chloroflexi bacterium]|nr:DUF1501 domain-containing protein [Chloroflexota bacterium]MCH8114159.1 DUF1501 domain-containing protein [Chloroflexota bacterium]MCI0834733.1 DUF1501 domain-containing protein [Chloroflexota bacterium]MCI0871194.1 DUF1501 domain-containing protein [Chloroflexota bacterium]
MVTAERKPSLVVIQLSGGNDAMNTVVPYTNGIYHDSRKAIHLTEEHVLDLDGTLGLNPSMGPMKSIWDTGKMAIINGIGYPKPNRSHFRSMDIWHTAESDHIADSGWLGRTIRELDPDGNNVITGINFGRGLPRALHCKGVPVASVGNLETYGLMPDIADRMTRELAVDVFARMYGPDDTRDAVLQAIGETGMGAYLGADILRAAPKAYSSTVEYEAEVPIAQSLRDISQVMLAELGTRVFYTQHAGYDTHAGELENHAKLWHELSTAVNDFLADLEEHGRGDDAVVLIFSEFGRRIRDNGSGTDHGSGGVAFVLGNSVKGGFYGEYPSLEPGEQVEGDMRFNNDFRGTYATLLDQWMGIDPHTVLDGNYEQFDMIRR